MEQNRLSEVNEDLNAFTYYQASMNNLLIDDCYSTPSLPESFKDLQNLVNEKEAELSKEAWKIEHGISEPIKNEYSVEDYKTMMTQIMIKYRDTKYDVLFTYDVYQCENPDYLSFQKLNKSMQEYHTKLESAAAEKEMIKTAEKIKIAENVKTNDYDYLNIKAHDITEYPILYNECLSKTDEIFCKNILNDAVNNYCGLKISSLFNVETDRLANSGTVNPTYNNPNYTLVIYCIKLTNRDIIQNDPINMESQQMLECIDDNIGRIDIASTCIKNWN